MNDSRKKDNKMVKVFCSVGMLKIVNELCIYFMILMEIFNLKIKIGNQISLLE